MVVIDVQQRRTCSVDTSHRNVRVMRLAWFFVVAACTTPPLPDAATGELGAWQMGPALPQQIANHCSAVIEDWVLVIGGTYSTPQGFAKTDLIQAAQLVDGVLGPWHLAGHTPSPVSECTATSDGRSLYVIDGIYDNESDARQVYTATLDATGTLGALTSLGHLPTDTIVISSEATVRQHELLLMDTRLPTEGDKTVTLRSPLAAMAWTVDDWGVNFRAQSEYAFTDNFIYTIGGYHDPAIGAVTDVFVAPATGGPAVPTSALAAATGFGEAMAVDDWVFVVGGRAATFGNGTTQVQAAQIAADGTLGAWRMLPALPIARTNYELSLVGDYLVATGGTPMGPGDGVVLVSQVRFSQSQ